VNWQLGQEMKVGDRSYGTISTIVRDGGRIVQIGSYEYRRTRRVTWGFHFGEDGAIRITGPSKPW